MWFNLFWTGIFGAILGFLTATGQKDLMLIYAILGLSIFAALTYVCVKILKGSLYSSILCSAILFFSSIIYFGLTYSIVLALIGWFLGKISLWLSSGNYRLGLPPYATSMEVLWFYGFRFICGLIFLFLIAPILIVFPLSFNIEPYFSFTEGMLNFNPDAYSLRWYKDILYNGMVAPQAIEG